METSLDTNEQPALTRMIYAFCGGTVFYWLLEYSVMVVFSRQRPVPWALYRWGDYVTNGGFFAAMLIVVAAYGFRAEVFLWRDEPTERVTSCVSSGFLGILGGLVALLIASPTVWFGWDTARLRSIGTLIANALSPLPILFLVVVALALAFSSEMVFRGIVLKTLARYTTISAAALVSCLLFACLFPVLGLVAAIILGVTSSILYYSTRNLVAPILANALFTVGCSGIALYQRLR